MASGAPECPVHWELKSNFSPCGQPLKSQPKCFQQIGQCFYGSGQWLFEVNKAQRHSGKSGLMRSNHMKCNGKLITCSLSSTKLQWDLIAWGLNEDNEYAPLPLLGPECLPRKLGKEARRLSERVRQFGHGNCALSHLACPPALQCLKICKRL